MRCLILICHFLFLLCITWRFPRPQIQLGLLLIIVEACSIRMFDNQYFVCDFTQQTRYIDLMLGECWPAVSDVDPPFTQHWFNVSCLLGNLLEVVVSQVQMGDNSNRHNYFLTLRRYRLSRGPFPTLGLRVSPTHKK